MIFFRSRFLDGVCQKAAVFQGSILTSLWITHDFQPKPSGHRQTPLKKSTSKKKHVITAKLDVAFYMFVT